MTTADPLDFSGAPSAPPSAAEPPDAPIPTAREAAFDPHAPKLGGGDRSLGLGRPAGRTLRAGPMVAVGGGLLGTAVLATALALQPSSPKVDKDKTETTTAPAATIPEAIKNAPSSPPANRVAAPVHSFSATAAPEAPPRRSLALSEAEREKLAELSERLKAENSGILFEGAGGAVEREPEPPRPAMAAAPAAPSAPSAPGGGAADDPGGQARKNAFVAGGGSGEVPLESPLQHPRSPYEIQAGTIIPAVLLTGIDSDLPGPVFAQVRESVYDSVSGNSLLIPQGSRLLAHYDSMVAWGQERVLLCWNRLILPNGDSLNLKCMPAADLAGAAGLADEVNEHWWKLLKGAAIASLLAATATAAAGNTEGFNPTVPQTLARNAGGEVNQVGQQVTRRDLMIQPTITVRPGFAVNVLVTRDMTLPPYRDGADAQRGARP